MNRNFRKRCIRFIFPLLLSGTICPTLLKGMTVVQDSAASRLFRRGEVCITRGDTSEALRFLQEAIQCDPRFSAAHHRIAQIYLGLGTLEDRILAREALEHALRYEPENLNVLLTQLHLELFIEYDGMARRLIRKILRIDSTNAEAHFAQGLLREKEWLKYRSMISVHGEPYDPVIIPFTEFVQKDLNIAKVSFRHAVRHNPTYIEAYTHLALLCFETEEPERMVTLLKEGLRHNPEHKDLLLFLGLAYHSQRQFDKALNTYMQARTQMTPEELALFESADLISTPTEAVRIQEVDETEKRKNVYAFWKQRDPLYLTEVNERLLEHYSRFAYANLRYRISAIPGVRQGIAGWGSDPGKVFIRYGSPLNEHSTWPAIKGTSADSKYATPPTPGRNPMSFSSMIWSYRDFSFTFQDYSLNRNYRFRWGVEGPDDKDFYHRFIKEVPEMYEYVPPEQRMRISGDTGRFRGLDNESIVDVYHTFSTEELDGQNASSISSLMRGVFFFDSEWNEIASERKRSPFLYTTGKNLLIGWTRTQILPGDYHLALEFLEEKTGKIGRWTTECAVLPYEARSLSMSDPILAWDIGPYRVSGELRRGEKRIVPNTFRSFPVSMNIPVYFEVYNLSFSSAGQTHYRITFTVEPIGGRSGMGRFFNRLTRGRESRGKIVTSYEMWGEDRSATFDQELRLLNPSEQSYRLRIQIKDLITGESVRTDRTFHLIQPDSLLVEDE